MKNMVSYFSGILFFLLATPVHAAVVINEMVPKSSDTAAAWIELYNSGADTVPLDRWRLTTKAGSTFQFNASATISPKGFITVYQSQTNLNFSIEGDTVSLFDEKNSSIDTQSYPGILGYNTAMGRSIDGGNGWTICVPAPEYKATPNAANKCPPPPTNTPTPTISPSPTFSPTPSPVSFIPEQNTPSPEMRSSSFPFPEVKGANTTLTPTRIPDVRESDWYSTLWTVGLIAGVALGSIILIVSIYRDFIRRP